MWPALAAAAVPAVLLPSLRAMAPHASSRARSSLTRLSADLGREFLEDEEEAADEARRNVTNEAMFATFFTPGSPYELDVARMEELVQWRRERRATPRAVQQIRQANRAPGELDPFSREDVLDHPIYGLTACLERMAQASALRTRLQPLARSALVGVAAVGWRHPAVAAALSAALAPLVHWALPIAHLIRTACANRAPKPASRPALSGREPQLSGGLPPPAAPDVMCASYLMCATGVLIARGLLATHNALEPLSLALTARILMFGSLWYWRDLSIELRRGQRRALARAWRLAASALCVLEAAALGRALCYAFFSAPQAAMLAPGWPRELPQPLGAAARSLLSPFRLSAMGRRCVLSPLIPDHLFRPLKHVSAMLPAGGGALAAWVSNSFSGALVARVAAAAFAFYFTWWHAFPAEALTRRQFRASLLPMRQPVSTGGTWLLQRLGVAGVPLGGDELIRRTGVSAAHRRPLTPSDDKLGHPFPSFFSRQTQAEQGMTSWREQPMDLLDLLHLESELGARDFDWRDDPTRALRIAAEAQARPNSTFVFDRAAPLASAGEVSEEMTKLQKLRFYLSSWDARPRARNAGSRIVPTVQGEDVPMMPSEGDQARRRLRRFEDGVAAGRLAVAAAGSGGEALMDGMVGDMVGGLDAAVLSDAMGAELSAPEEDEAGDDAG